MRNIRRIVFGMTVVLAVSRVPSALACPNCKDAVANQDGDAQKLADGYSWSILVMIGMPFALLGLGTLMVTRAARRGSFPEL